MYMQISEASINGFLHLSEGFINLMKTKANHSRKKDGFRINLLLFPTVIYEKCFWWAKLGWTPSWLDLKKKP